MGFFKDLCKGLFNLIGSVFYSLDLYSDFTLALLFFRQGDIVWGSLTMGFLFIPLIICNVCAFFGINKMREKNGIWKLDNFYVRLVCCLTLTLPFILMVLGTVQAFQGNENDCLFAAQGIKLLEVFLESFPQCCLQLYIVFQVLYGDNITVKVDWWQWTTLCISMVNLSFSIATGYFHAERAAGLLNADPRSISKVVYFFFGGLAIVSRLTVCSMMAIISKPLWLLPIGSLFSVSVAIWLFKRFFTNELNVWPHYHCSITKVGLIILIAFTTTVYKSFTVSGLMIGSFFYVPASMTSVGISAITLASVSLVANTILIAIPKLRDTIGDDWLLNDTFY